MSRPDLATPPPPPRPRTVRLNPEKLYVALDRRRRELRITNRELLRQVGERTPSAMTRLGQGFQPSADLLIRFLVWLGDTDVAPYLTPCDTDSEVTG